MDAPVKNSRANIAQIPDRTGWGAMMGIGNIYFPLKVATVARPYFLTICFITDKQLNEQTKRDSLSAADFHLDPSICVDISFSSHDSVADCTEST